MGLLLLLEYREGELAVTVPNQWYITDLIAYHMATLFNQKMYVDIDAEDAARAMLIKTGPRQQDPVAVGIFIYENELESPGSWPHAQDTLLSVGLSRGASGMEGVRITGQPVARQTIGMPSSWEYQRAFTILQEVWLEKVPDVERTEANLQRLSGIVAGRVRRTLKDGGLGLGTGQSLIDDFGEMTIDGPFFGEEKLVRQVGKQLFTMRYLQIWYRTSES
jgi:hypothetical protein